MSNETNIHLWAASRAQRKKESKDEILARVRSLTSVILDLRLLNVLELQNLERALKDKPRSFTLPQGKQTKSYYIQCLNLLVPNVKNAHRLSLGTLQQLVQEFINEEK